MPGAATVALSTSLGTALTTAALAANISVFAAVAIGVVGTIVQTIVVSMVIGAISSALSSKPNASGGSRGGAPPDVASLAKDRTVTFRQPIVSHRTIYGEVRVAGPVTFVESTDENEKLHQLITIAGHPVQEIGEFWVNEDKVTLSGTSVNSGDFSGYISVFTGDGSGGGDTSLLDALTSATSGWTSNHKQLNRAKIYMRFDYDSDVFIGALPSLSALVKGKKILDTRSGGTLYSNNPALCIYDYLTDTDTGVGEATSRIDTDSFDTAANDCDEDVSVVMTRTFSTTHSIELLTLSSASNGLRTGDKVGVSSDNTLPAGLSATTDYYWISFSSTAGYLADSKINALNGLKVQFTSDGTGTHTIARKQSRTFTATTADVLTLTSKIKELLTGDGLEVSNSGGALPTGLSASTTYYWIRITDTTGSLATTRLNALAGTAIDITGTGSGTQTIERTVEARYTCNGTIDTSRTPKDILSQLLISLHGSLVYQNGKWNLYSGVYRSPTITLTEDDMIGPLDIQVKLTRRESFNGVKGVFVSPADNYQPTDFPSVTNATYLTEDQEERTWKDTDFQFTVSPSTAQRISKIDLERARQQITVNITTNLTGLRLQAGDTVSLTNDRMGWSAKAFDVVEWALMSQNDANGAPSLICRMKLRETASTVYDWEGGEETVIDLSPNTTLPSARSVATPSAPSIVESLYNTTDGTGVKAKATMTWATVADLFVEDYIAQYKLTTDSIYTSLARTDNLTIDVLDIKPGTYDFRLIAVNFLGIKSTASAITTQEITGLGAVPTAPQNLTLSAIAGLALLRWDQTADLDVKFGGKIEIRHDQLTAGASLATSVIIASGIGGQETQAVLPLKVGTYLVRMFDSSNLKSSASTVTTKQATVLTFSSLSSISEHATFVGTHSSTLVSGTDLTLSGADLIDDWADIDTVASWDVEGGVSSEGTYTFANSFDFGSVVLKRLTTVLTVSIVNVLDLIDSRTDNIDDWEDFDGTAGADATAQVFVRHTDDDPAGSPTWTSWEKLDSAEFEARAFQFKCVLTTNDPSYTIKVSELTINSEEV